MTAFERLGYLAAQCDLKAQRDPEFRAIYVRLAAEYRKKQVESLARRGWWARVREWLGGARCQ